MSKKDQSKEEKDAIFMGAIAFLFLQNKTEQLKKLAEVLKK